MQYSESNRIASEHTHPDRMAYDIYRRNPRFDSAQQFGVFVTLVADHWLGGAPGLGSSTMLAIENYRLGCIIQTSPNYSDCQDVFAVYHVGWVMRVLRATRARIIEHHRKKMRENDPTNHPKRCKCARCSATEARCLGLGRQTGEQSFSIWTNVDIFGAKQCDVAKATNLSDSTISRRLRAIRVVVEDELKAEHKLSV